MKIKDIHSIELTKDNTKQITSNFNKGWQLVETYCSDFLKLYRTGKTERLLFRGFKRTTSRPIIFGQSRDDRRVVPGSDKIKAKACDYFMTMNGVEALRGNSLFCNSDERHAAYWGTTYIIFPINGFKYAYSMFYSGLPANGYVYPFEPQFFEFLDELEAKSSNIRTDSYLLRKWANKFMIDNEITTNHLEYAMNNNKDVWIKGKYIGFLAGYDDKESGLYYEQLLEDKIDEMVQNGN